MIYDLTKTGAEGRVSYPRIAHPTTHPDRIATVATLYGMTPVPVQRCRVLELGCATGGNLIPMAELSPESQFLGIDVTASEISLGHDVIQELGLENIRLEPIDIRSFDESRGQFDYIICTGVHSWTPREVQDKIVKICSRNLAANGIACVNYNTYPGWHSQGVIRDALRFFAMKHDEPETRARYAKKALDFLYQTISTKDHPYGALLKGLLEAIHDKPEGFLYHAYVDVPNHPVYFHQFMQRAAYVGLQYLGDSRAGLRWSQGLPENVERELAGLTADPLEREQFVDFLVNRMRRDSLLCHRQILLSKDIAPTGIRHLYLSANVQPGSQNVDFVSDMPVEFRSADGRSFRVADRGLKAALVILAQHWPRNLAMSELQAEVRKNAVLESEDKLLVSLAELYRHGVVDLDASPSKFTVEISDRPSVSRLARHQAVKGNVVTNLKHQMVQLDDVDRQLVRRLDGSCTHGQLADSLSDPARGEQLTGPASQAPADRARTVAMSLQRLAQRALLLDPNFT